jgi:hypothetical protein
LQTVSSQRGPLPITYSIVIAAAPDAAPIVIGKALGFTSLIAGGIGHITDDGSGTVLGAKLTATTDTGSIGTSENNGSLLTQVSYLTVTTGGEGNAYITNSIGANTTISSASVGGTFRLITNGGITNSTTIQADNINLQTSGNGDTISLARTVGQAAGTISLTAGGAGDILVATTLTGDSVSATSGSGRIILNGVQADQVTTNTGGAGVVTLSLTGSTTLMNSTSGSNFKATDTTGFTADNVTSTNGGVTLIATNGTLTVAAGKTIKAENGPVVLQAANANSGTIVLGTGANVLASASILSKATVSLYVGNTPPQTNTTAPTNMIVTTQNGGNAYFGTNSIQVNSASTVYANTGKNASSAITLDGGNAVNTNHAPIAFERGGEAPGELVVDTGDDGDDAATDSDKLVDAEQ